MGKTRIIAETGAGQHGVATATVCARFGLECVVYMGATRRRAAEAQRLPHEAARRRGRAGDLGLARRSKDAMNEALRDWVTNVDDTFYIIGTVAGPHPYPAMVRDFQCVIGNEAREPDARPARAACPTLWSPASAAAPTPWACSTPSSTIRTCAMIGVEAGGHGLDDASEHAASLSGGRPGVLHGNAHLPAAGRRRPDHRRRTRSPPASTTPASAPSTPGCTTSAGSTYVAATDAEALDAFQLLLRDRGHHPRARAGPRPRPRGEDRPDLADATISS